MQYIDKSKNQKNGNAVINELLHRAWNAEEHKYIGADYNNLNTKDYRPRLIDLTLEEQNKYCCYCMKRITEEETTLEHIIPQKTSQADFGSYLHVAELANRVIHKDLFNRVVYTIPPEKYPHDIAYYNLVASCNSYEHCNHKRGDITIAPLVYYTDISQLVIYENNGSIDASDIVIDALNLNSRYLKMIRLLWKRLAEIKDKTLSNILAEIKGFLEEIISVDEESLRNTFTGAKLEEFKKYCWFYHYYQSKLKTT